MSFRFLRSYRGPVKAVIFDWAGTLIDYGSNAPVHAFKEVFRRQGIAINSEQVRGPMGTHKKDHIRAILQIPEVTKAFAQKHGYPNEGSVEKIYAEFIPLQLECIAEHSALIANALTTVPELRGRGLKIGSTTGYTREIMEAVVPQARRQGLIVDSIVCASDVKEGRPAPWMCFKNAENLNIYPTQAMVKVGDTLTDIEEGLNAGMWSVGVAKSGNEIGLSESEVAALDDGDLRRRLDVAYKRLFAAGAHYVIDTVDQLPSVINSIENKLAEGVQP